MIRCNMCMSDWDDSDYVHLCPICDTDEYMMDLTIIPAPKCENCTYESSSLDESTNFCYNCQLAYRKGYEDAKLGI